MLSFGVHGPLVDIKQIYSFGILEDDTKPHPLSVST
jgi:hypothetical protein